LTASRKIPVDQARGAEQFGVEAEIGSMADAYGYLFRRAHALFGASYNDYFAGTGLNITPVLGGMLILIDENPGLSQIELARLMRIEGSSMWQNVTRLIELGYIDRRRQEHDQRAFALDLTERGRKAVPRIKAGMLRHQRDMMSVLSDAERAQLRSMLLRLIDEGERRRDLAATSTARGGEAGRKTPPWRARRAAG